MRKRIRLTNLVIMALSLCIFLHGSQVVLFANEETNSPGTTTSLDEEGKIQLLRCLFTERRLVIRYNERIIVLHEGDTLPSSQLRVDGFSQGRLVLTAGATTISGNQGTVTLPQTMIIVEKVAGGLKITRFSDRPEPRDTMMPVARSTSVFVPSSPDGTVSFGPALKQKSQ